MTSEWTDKERKLSSSHLKQMLLKACIAQMIMVNQQH